MRLRRGWCVVGVAVLSMTGCTGGSAPAPTSGSVTGATSVSSGAPAPSVGASLVVPSGTPSVLVAPSLGTPVVSVSGVVDEQELTVGVIAVEASGDATRLRLSLASRVPVASFGVRAWAGKRGTNDIGSVVVVEPGQGRRLKPSYIISGELVVDVLCVCSRQPRSLGTEPVELQALLQPLAQGTTTVQVVLPGLKPMTAPVTWT